MHSCDVRARDKRRIPRDRIGHAHLFAARLSHTSRTSNSTRPPPRTARASLAGSTFRLRLRAGLPGLRSVHLFLPLDTLGLAIALRLLTVYAAFCWADTSLTASVFEQTRLLYTSLLFAPHGLFCRRAKGLLRRTTGESAAVCRTAGGHFAAGVAGRPVDGAASGGRASGTGHTRATHCDSCGDSRGRAFTASSSNTCAE